MTTGSISLFLSALGRGEPAAVEVIFARSFPRLVALARKTLKGRPTAVADAEDAALSATASLWQKANGDGLNTLLDRNELWALLATITVRKAKKQVRREQAAKRGGQVRVHAPELLDQVGIQATGDLDLCCEQMLSGLDEEQRQIALLRLAGWKDREIAEHLGCTQRKVERKLNLIRQRWADE